MDLQQRFNTRQSRRSVLRQLGALAGASLTLDACSGNTFVPPRPGPTATGNLTSIKHVVLACQENRSFDTYFGYYPKAGPFGIPSGYTQPNGHGGNISPSHFRSPVLHDITHSWQPIHREWDNGAMDGFYTTNGPSALGYYDGARPALLLRPGHGLYLVWQLLQLPAWAHLP
jgi:phospholipase C